jgi:hypothetical protein
MNELNGNEGAETVPVPVNLVSTVSKEKLEKLADAVVNGFLADKKERETAGWDIERAKHWDLSHGKAPKRVLPWERAANAVVPILASACIQAGSRIYASVMQNPDKSVAALRPRGPEDVRRAKRGTDYINWQLLSEADGYEEGWDDTCDELPRSGSVFRKITLGKDDEIRAEMVSAAHVYIPWNTRKLAKARRITHRMREHYDEAEDLLDEGFYDSAAFKSIDKSNWSSANDVMDDSPMEAANKEMQDQAEAPLDSEQQSGVVLEQTLRYKLDGKKRGYFIVWVHKESNTVLRIVDREVVAGDREFVLDRWVQYNFFPNPHGAYGYGYGHLLFELNLIANSLWNQYIDGGTLANKPIIFFGRGAGLKGRRLTVSPGDSIPVGDISQVLLTKFPGLDQHMPQMIQMVQRFAEELSSNVDEVQGRSPKGVREPTVGGTSQRIEQGLMSFGILTKRVLRQMKDEIRIVCRLNELFMPEFKQHRVLGITSGAPFSKVYREDFARDYDYAPTGSPTFASPSQRRSEAGEVIAVMQTHPAIIGTEDGSLPPNPAALVESLRSYLKEFEQTEILQYIPPAPEPPIPAGQENALFMQGETVEPKQGEAHDEHLVAHKAFMVTASFASMSEDRQLAVLTHVEFTEALKIEEQTQKTLEAAQASEQPQAGPQQQLAQGGDPNAAG